MALRWEWNEKVGKVYLTQKQKSGNYKFSVDIYIGNAFGIFIHEYKDTESGNDMYNVYNFLLDKAHANRVLKNGGSILEGYKTNVRKIEIDVSTKGAEDLAKYLIDKGYKVTCYKK